MDERITAVKQHTSIMENLKLPKEVIGYVNSIEEGSVSEWIYLCALDGIPLKALERLGAANAGDVYKKVAFIRSERQKFLKRIYGDNEVRQNIEEMYRQVRSISEENQQLHGMIEASLGRVGRIQEDACGNQKKAYELELKDREEKLVERDRRIQTLEGELKHMKDRERALLEKIKESEEERAGKPEVPVYGNIRSSGWIRSFLNGRASKAFIETYLKAEAYTGEQKEYLLQCFEQGTPLKEIRKFASPGVPVHIMERLRKNLVKT